MAFVVAHSSLVDVIGWPIGTISFEAFGHPSSSVLLEAHSMTSNMSASTTST